MTDDEIKALAKTLRMPAIMRDTRECRGALAAFAGRVRAAALEEAAKTAQEAAERIRLASTYRGRISAAAAFGVSVIVECAAAIRAAKGE